MRTNAKPETLQRALQVLNRHYGNNVQFDRFDVHPRCVDFTLRVRSSRGPGARRSFTGRRMAKACWHVHGKFFEYVLALDHQARIVSRWSGGPTTITRQSGNWQDANIGSQMQPLMFSQACDCTSLIWAQRDKR